MATSIIKSRFITKEFSVTTTLNNEATVQLSIPDFTLNGYDIKSVTVYPSHAFIYTTYFGIDTGGRGYISVYNKGGTQSNELIRIIVIYEKS